MIERLLSEEVQSFIATHENDDPFQLALKFKAVNGVSMALISEQILSKQKAKTKLPTWYGTENIVFPPKLSMEQCSSEVTALYKASLLGGKHFVDLTGGAGVDTWAIAQFFESGDYVEQNEDLTEIVSLNFKSLHVGNIKIHHTQAEDYLETIAEKIDCIYIDPARRDNHKNRVFLLEDCTPDITSLLPELKKRAGTILIKTSPMMDIDLSLKALPGVAEVHVIAVENDCKEVLYKVSDVQSSDIRVKAVNFKKGKQEEVEFLFKKNKEAQASYAEPKKFLYEPNAAMLKAGAFDLISEKYAVQKLHANTHLYTSKELVEHFPGRCFSIDRVLPYSKKELKKAIPGGKINIAVRNFKDDVATIRKKTGLKDGGELYLFGFTDINNQQRLALCEKACDVLQTCLPARKTE